MLVLSVGENRFQLLKCGNFFFLSHQSPFVGCFALSLKFFSLLIKLVKLCHYYIFVPNLLLNLFLCFFSFPIENQNFIPKKYISFLSYSKCIIASRQVYCYVFELFFRVLKFFLKTTEGEKLFEPFIAHSGLHLLLLLKRFRFKIFLD